MSDKTNQDQINEYADSQSVSPNIKSEADEIEAVEQAQEEAINPKEKVEIDHIPIADEDIEFRAEDIQKKDTGDLFVNVSDAEKVAKEKERKRLLAEKQKAKEEEEKKRIAEREHAKKVKEEQEKKVAIAKKEKQREEAAKAVLRKDEAERKQRERHEAKMERRYKRQKFFKKYRFAILAVVAVVIVAGAAVAWACYYNDNRLAIKGAETSEDMDDVQTKIAEIYYGKEINPDEYGADTDLDFSNTSSENYKKAMDYLDGVINSTKDKNLKAKAMIMKANILLDAKEASEAKAILDTIDVDSLEKEEHGDYLGAVMRHAIITDNNEERTWSENELKKLNGVVDEKAPE